MFLGTLCRSYSRPAFPKLGVATPWEGDKNWKKIDKKINVEMEMHVAVSKMSWQTSTPVPLNG
jgi:hypothetical protein